MKKSTIFLLVIVVFMTTTSCTSKITKEDSSIINEAYLLKMSEKWRGEIRGQKGVIGVKIAQSFFGPYSEKRRRAFYKEKTNLEIATSPRSRKHYIIKTSSLLPGDNVFIQIFEVLRE